MKRLNSMSIKALLITALMFSTVPAVSAASTTAEYAPRSIHVTASGKTTVQADAAILNLSVETKGITAKEAQNKNREDVKKVTNILLAQGVGQGNIKNSYYTLYPDYDYSEALVTTNSRQAVKGYNASYSMTVEISNINKISDILDSVVDVESVRIGGTSYKVSNKLAAETEARTMAIRSAKLKATNLASIFNVKLGKILYINEYSYDNGGAYYDSVQQNNVDVTMQIELTFEISD